MSLSPGEAEMVGVTKGAAAVLGVRSLLTGLGANWPMRVWTGSSTSIGMCTRQGIGKVRHLEVRYLWLQKAVREDRLRVRKVLGTENPSDVPTKAKSKREINMLGREASFPL